MEEDMTYRKLYVENILFSTSGTGLRDYFLQFGAVTEAFVVYDIHGGSRGYGFVTFLNLQDAATACQIRFHFIDGRRTYCNLAAFPVQKTSQPSSPYRGPRMHFGGAVPRPSPFPLFPYPRPYMIPYRPPNYPMYGPPPMYGVPPVYPMHGPGSVPPVYPYGQASGSNEPANGSPMSDASLSANSSVEEASS